MKSRVKPSRSVYHPILQHRDFNISINASESCCNQRLLVITACETKPFSDVTLGTLTSSGENLWIETTHTPNSRYNLPAWHLSIVQPESIVLYVCLKFKMNGNKLVHLQKYYPTIISIVLMYRFFLVFSRVQSLWAFQRLARREEETGFYLWD